MKIENRCWTQHKGWSEKHSELKDRANLIFVFGETNLLKQKSLLDDVKKQHPNATLFGCSTAGEIFSDHIYDDAIVTTSIQFEKTTIKSKAILLSETKNCFEAGVKLAHSIPHEELCHVFVLSVGLNVNGSDLVRGLSSVFPSQVSITGGLAGDQSKFSETLVVLDDLVSNDAVAIVGLYGKNLQVGTASLGGWDSFGPERLVTKSKGNILYELDNKSALELYKKYLGDHAKNLPGSALLFPLCLRTNAPHPGIVRTILGIDESNQSMTFAGDVPEGSYGRFMKANFDRLIEGAVGAAKQALNR